MTEMSEGLIYCVKKKSKQNKKKKDFVDCVV